MTPTIRALSAALLGAIGLLVAAVGSALATDGARRE